MLYRLIISISLSLFFSTIALSQDYDIIFKGYYNSSHSSVGQRTFETRSFTPTSDSTSLQTTFESTFIDSFKVTPKYNVELGVGQRFKLIGDLKARGSISVGYRSFETSVHTELASMTLLSSMEVPSDNTNTVIGSSDCIIFLNSFSDLPEANRNPQVEMINLSLGLDLVHPVIIPRLNAGIGVRMSTPILTRSRVDQIFLERHPVEDGFECEFVFNTLSDKSGDGFQNLKGEWSAFVEYQMFDKIIFQLGYSESISNIYASSPINSISFQAVANSYKPKQVYLGFGYFFNRKMKMEDISEDL